MSIYWKFSKSKLASRNLIRQTFEMMLLFVFQPRTKGITNQKQFSARILLTFIILVGLVMRKLIGGRMNSLLTLQPIDYITSLDELIEQSELSLIVDRNTIASYIVRTSQEPIWKKLRERKIRFQNISSNYDYESEFAYIKMVLNQNYIIISESGKVKNLVKKYKELPLIDCHIHETDSFQLIYPVITHSEHFHKIYYA